jgi:glyoxylase-like metal-dependent hydrolase (beta-lactamase superfamily II)
MNNLNKISEISLVRQNPYVSGNGYLHIQTFDLNSRQTSPLGTPANLPADSFLITYYRDDQKVQILLDAGKRHQGTNIIIPHLLAQGIMKLNMVILSHPHQDLSAV